jgi:hypothetical protein
MFDAEGLVSRRIAGAVLLVASLGSCDDARSPTHESDDLGVLADEGGGTADASSVDAALCCGCVVGAWVVIEDRTGEDINAEYGFAGADICGVEVTCEDGRQAFGVEVRPLDPGWGFVCCGDREEREVDRSNPMAVLGPPEDPCEHDLDPRYPSPYVSIGYEGRIAVRIGRESLAGCTLRILEAGSGRDNYPERYRVKVCTEPDEVDCRWTSAGDGLLTGPQTLDCCTCD